MAGDPSFRKINYLLRPTKQVERRLIVDILSRLLSRYDIPSYRYIGFGSVYYADFLMFHRLLRISDMWCVEQEPVPLAMEFNRPFEFVRVFIGPVASVAPSIDRARPHLVWLDFDRAMDDESLRDIREVAALLPAGSVFIASLQARPPEPQLEYEDAACYQGRVAASAREWSTRVGAFRRRRVRATDLTSRGLGRLYQDVLSKAISSSISSRTDADLRFYQLFSYRYRDGVPMFTVGGLIEAPRRQRAITATGIPTLEYAATDPSAEPIEISVPALTLREKAWFEKNVSADPAAAGAFEIDARSAANFRRFYRFYPTYNEVVF